MKKRFYMEAVVPGVFMTKGHGALWKSCNDGMTRVSSKAFKDKRKTRNMIYVNHKKRKD